MTKKIFLTFSSQKTKSSDKNISKIIDVLDKSERYKILYRWFDTKEPEKLSHYDIYETSIKSLLKADLLIAEVSTPSIGVGQQIAIAMFHKIPVLILAESKTKNKNTPSFLKGIKSTNVSFLYYNQKTDITDDLLSTIKSKINDSFEKLNFVATKSIKKLLIEESRNLKISQSELLRQIITDWKDRNS